MAEGRTAVRMARLVGQWRKSDESGASFARRHQIPAWTFWYWQRKLSATPPAVLAPTFVPVQVTGEVHEPVLEILFSSGDRLQVRAGASAELVRAAVSVLRSAC